VTGHLLVRDVMRPAVTSVERHAHVAAAAYLMKRAGDDALVVINDEHQHVPVAVITDTDVAQVVADGKDPNEVRISDLVQREPITIAPESSLTDAAELMVDHHIRHLPVVSGGRLQGVVDISDICRGLVRTAGGA
jgi:CBS domain-containing protein